MVLLLTDGVVEAHGADEDLFGIERGVAAGEGPPDRPAREVLNALFGASATSADRSPSPTT